MLTVRNGKQTHSADCIWSWGHWSTSIYSFTFPTLNQVWSPRCPKLCRNYTVALAALLHWLVTLMIKKQNRTKHHPSFFFFPVHILALLCWLACMVGSRDGEKLAAPSSTLKAWRNTSLLQLVYAGVMLCGCLAGAREARPKLQIQYQIEMRHGNRSCFVCEQP